MLDIDGFELIFNIDAKEKFYFGNLSLKLPNDFDETNFEDINKIFDELSDKAYSINSVEK